MDFQESSPDHSSKASILHHSALFMVQFSHPYVTNGKTIALTIWIFVRRVMSLLFNTLSRFGTAFLPRNNHLISRLQSWSTVILEHNKRKPAISSTFYPSICHEVPGLDAHDLSFWGFFCFCFFSFKPALLLFSFTLINRLFSSASLSAIGRKYLQVIYVKSDLDPKYKELFKLDNEKNNPKAKSLNRRF